MGFLSLIKFYKYHEECRKMTRSSRLHVKKFKFLRVKKIILQLKMLSDGPLITNPVAIDKQEIYAIYCCQYCGAYYTVII